MVPGTHRTLGALLACGCLVAGAALARPASAVGQTPPEVPPEVRNLVDRLLSPDPQERGNAARALGQMGESAVPAVPMLVGLLGDMGIYKEMSGMPPVTPTPVGRMAAEALARIGRPGVAPVITALAKESATVREHAVAALARMGLSAVEPLHEALAATDDVLRCHAALALSQIGDSRSIGPLMKALQDKDRQVKLKATSVLGGAGGEIWWGAGVGVECGFGRYSVFLPNRGLVFSNPHQLRV
jgi:HEAT repeat protein